jgi:large subunit ribosomal protein L21
LLLGKSRNGSSLPAVFHRLYPDNRGWGVSNRLTRRTFTAKISRFPGFVLVGDPPCTQSSKPAASNIAGDKLKIEKLEAEIGSEITFDQVLMVGDGADIKMGAPMLRGATVTATVLNQARGDKIKIFKMRRRKHYRKSQGHRQYFTEVQIGGITA